MMGLCFECNIVRMQTALGTWNAVLSFLSQPTAASYDKIEAAVRATGFENTSPGTQCDQLANVDEVREALASTRFASLLEC